MEERLVVRATAVASSLAQDMGLKVDHVVVLQNSNKLGLRLQPCDTFPRTALLGQEVADFEIRIAMSLAAVTAPVASLDPRIEPNVYERDGFAITFWSDYQPVTVASSPAAYAAALHRLHAAMRRVEIEAPHFTQRIAEAEHLVTRRHDTPALSDGDRALLLDTLTSARQTICTRGRGPTSARRAASRQPAAHHRRPGLHRLRNVLPWPDRI